MTFIQKFYNSLVFSPDQNKRSGWIDYTRGFVIIYVVYRHVTAGLNLAGIEAFQGVFLIHEASMPIFFIVSGIFIHGSLTKRGIGKFVRYKVDNLMYPYFIWASSQLSIQLLFSQYTNTEKDISYFQYLFYYPRAFDQFWYLYTLFLAMIIFALLNTYVFRFNQILNFVFAIILFIGSYFITSELFGLNHLMFYYIFLVVGFALSNAFLSENSIIFSKKIFIPLIPILILLLVVWEYYYTDSKWLIDLEFKGYFLFLPITILTAMVIFLISNRLSKAGRFRLIRYIGSHSLYIYIMHLIVAGATRTILKSIGILDPVVQTLSGIAAGVIIPILIYQASMRLGLWFLYLPTKPKPKKVVPVSG